MRGEEGEYQGREEGVGGEGGRGRGGEGKVGERRGWEERGRWEREEGGRRGRKGERGRWEREGGGRRGRKGEEGEENMRKVFTMYQQCITILVCTSAGLMTLTSVSLPICTVAIST